MTRMRNKDYPPATNIREALAEVIREKQGARGWTTKHLGEVSGVDAQNLSRWLLPAIREIGTTEAAALAKAFDIPLAELYAEATARLDRVTAPEAETASQSDNVKSEAVTPMVPDRRRKGRTRAEMDKVLRLADRTGENNSTQANHAGEANTQ